MDNFSRQASKYENQERNMLKQISFKLQNVSINKKKKPFFVKEKSY